MSSQQKNTQNIPPDWRFPCHFHKPPHKYEASLIPFGHSAWSLGRLSPLLAWIKVTYFCWGRLSFSTLPELCLTLATVGDCPLESREDHGGWSLFPTNRKQKEFCAQEPHRVLLSFIWGRVLGTMANGTDTGSTGRLQMGPNKNTYSGLGFDYPAVVANIQSTVKELKQTRCCWMQVHAPVHVQWDQTSQNVSLKQRKVYSRANQGEWVTLAKKNPAFPSGFGGDVL